jgi:hypothetical protein
MNIRKEDGIVNMKKLVKPIIIVVVLIGGIGYGVYYFGTNIASEKMIEVVSKELENSGQIEEVKQYVESDPELKQFIKEVEATDQEPLPSTTKEKVTADQEPLPSPAKEEVAADQEPLPSTAKEEETVNQEPLPFTTKEEATRVVIEKVGISELSDIQAKVQEGTLSKEEALQTLQENLTEEEITALKVIAYKELYKQ